MPKNEQIYAILIDRMNKKGITIPALAKEIGVEYLTLYRIIHKQRKLTYDMACKIAKALKSTPDALFYNERI